MYSRFFATQVATCRAICVFLYTCQLLAVVDVQCSVRQVMYPGLVIHIVATSFRERLSIGTLELGRSCCFVGI